MKEKEAQLNFIKNDTNFHIIDFFISHLQHQFPFLEKKKRKSSSTPIKTFQHAHLFFNQESLIRDLCFGCYALARRSRSLCEKVSEKET